VSERDYLRSDWEGGPRSPWGRGGGFWSTHPATKAVIFLLVGIHLVLRLLAAVSPEAAGEVYRALMLDPDAVLRRFYVWQIVTGALLHDPNGIGHILFNCFSLYIFGRFVEDWLGPRRYLGFLAASAVAASLAYLLFAVLGNRVYPMLGASGAVMGVLAYVALRAPNLTVLLFFVLPIRMWVLALGAIVLDLLGALSVDSNVAHTAHLGGALYGLLYFRYGARVEGLFGGVDRLFDQQRVRREKRRHEQEAEMRVEIDRILDKVNREGMTALTDEERRFLRKAGQKLRR